MTDIADNSSAARFVKSSELVAWILFLFSAVFFVISALRSGDVPGLIGAFLFLFACIAFLLPYAGRALRLRDRV